MTGAQGSTVALTHTTLVKVVTVYAASIEGLTAEKKNKKSSTFKLASPARQRLQMVLLRIRNVCGPWRSHCKVLLKCQPSLKHTPLSAEGNRAWQLERRWQSMRVYQRLRQKPLCKFCHGFKSLPDSFSCLIHGVYTPETNSS